MDNNWGGLFSLLFTNYLPTGDAPDGNLMMRINSKPSKGITSKQQYFLSFLSTAAPSSDLFLYSY